MRWYFAMQVANNDLVAFTASGEVRTIFAAPSFHRISVFRIDQQSVLGVLHGGDDAGIYRLTPNGAQLLTPSVNSDVKSWPGFDKWFPKRRRGPSMLFIEHAESTSMMVANVDAMTWEVPTSKAGMEVVARFTADGLIMRYAGFASDDDGLMTIQERNLRTGEERTIYTVPFGSQVTTDAEGEHWLVAVSGGEWMVIDLSGGVEKVITRQAAESITCMMGDFALIQYSVDSLKACRFTITNLGDDTVQEVVVPGWNAHSSLHTFAQSAPGTRWIMQSQDGVVWTGDPQGKVVQVGYTPTGPYGVSLLNRSQDNRYILVVSSRDPAALYQVWDLETMQVLIEQPVEGLRGAMVEFYAQGFIMLYLGGTVRQTFYRYVDGGRFNLPAEMDMTCVEIVDNSRLMMLQGDNIFLYHVETGEHESLVDNARMLYSP